MSGPGDALSYEEAKKLARHGDAEARNVLAARKDIEPEILVFLAGDTTPEVRRTIAANQATPRQADLILAKDSDEAVRTGLAEKIAKVAPGLSASEKDQVRKAAHETLEVLARDQLTRVRQILAEALKDVADAPPEIIKGLALDEELVVSGPVLEFSPVLTDDDLLEIIEKGPAKGGLGTIARRSRVNESVADALADSDDDEAIADLLSNPSAQLREETLDVLIERAQSVELWHAPLAGRPHLPGGAAVRLATFLADNLLDILERRQDLDAETIEAVKSVVHRRIGGDAPEGKGGELDFLLSEAPIGVAERLFKAGRLDLKVIERALNANDFGFVLAALVVRSGQPEAVVKEIFSTHHVKGIVALAWKAKLSMKLAVLMQQRMARTAPTEILKAAEGNEFPLGDDEMNWQLEFFSSRSGNKKG
ncbi:MAG: DUF2336 domain-containing protein [Proteobacteria bacterium]|nr:DUF2336 domain-containing protein [Pseudomonadota bacterium]